MRVRSWRSAPVCVQHAAVVALVAVMFALIVGRWSQTTLTFLGFGALTVVGWLVTIAVSRVRGHRSASGRRPRDDR